MQKETFKGNFIGVNKIVFQMMLEKETALNKVSDNTGLICLTTIFKINHTFRRGELFLKQLVFRVFTS